MSDSTARSQPADELAFQQTLCRRMIDFDPFANDRVSDLSEGSIDVCEIHQAPFERLTRLAKESLSLGRGIGVVLWGEPGIGKSHLLARFSRWAQTDQRGYYFFLHNLQVSPERLPRYVLKCVLHQMSVGPDGQMFGGPLYTLMNRIAHMALVRFKRDIHRERTPATIRKDVMRFLQVRGVMETIDDKTIYSVFIEFFLSLLKLRQRHNGVALANESLDWLSGDTLVEHDAFQLGKLTQGSPLETSLPDDQAVSRVLVAISNLARLTGRSFTLCFDQVENLGEPEMQALSKFTHGLIDHARNLLVVTSGVQRDLFEYKHNVIRSSAWDRIAQHEIALTRIDTHLGKQLLIARLQPFLQHDAFAGSGSGELLSDRLFPLGMCWFQRRMSNLVEVRPRDVIAWARRRWTESREAILDRGGESWFQDLKQDCEDFQASCCESKQNGNLSIAAPNGNHQRIDEAVAARLEHHCETRRQARGKAAPDGETVANVIEGLLQQCLHAPWSYELVDIDHPGGRGNQQPPYRFVARTRNAAGESTIGFAFLVTESKTKASGVLRRVACDKTRPGLVLLISDVRAPLQFGGRGKNHLDRIAADGEYRTVELCADDREQLESMSAVINDARLGRLEWLDASQNPHRIEPSDVIASFHRTDMYRRVDLLAGVLGERTPNASYSARRKRAATPATALSDTMLQRFIMARLALAGWMSMTELAGEFIRDHGMHDEWSVETIRPLLDAAAAKLESEGKLAKSETGVQLTLELAGLTG